MFSPAIASALREREHDVVAVVELGELRAMTDAAVFAWAIFRSVLFIRRRLPGVPALRAGWVEQPYTLPQYQQCGFGGLGYRPPYPADWDEAAELVTGDEARYLAGADLYVMTPHMCDVVIAAAQSLTLEDLQLVDEDDLPSPTGLLVLPHPLLVKGVGGDLGDDRAFCWHTPASFTVPDPDAADRVRSRSAVRISVYHDTHGPVQPDSFLDFAAEARRAGTPLPPLLLDAVRCLAFQTEGLADPQAPQRLAHAAQAVAGAYRRSAEIVGQNEDRVVGEYASGSQIDDVDDTFALRFLYAFWRLCEQRIAAIEPVQTNHAARVIAERTGLSPEVRVIRLRQRAGHTSDQPAGREWQHRWVVRKHKVRPVVPERTAAQDYLPRAVYQGPGRQTSARRRDRSRRPPSSTHLVR